MTGNVLETPWRGRCLCGAVSVEVRAPASALMCCHCAQCRKTAGSAFIAVVPVDQADFTLRDPANCLRPYSATPGKSRYFCARCGSPVYSKRDDATTVRVRVGLFDEMPGVVHGGHIFTATAAPWDDIGGTLPRYERFEPSR